MVAITSDAASAVLPRRQESFAPRPAPWKRRSRVLEYATDALIVAALAFSVPIVILLVGAPLALAVRALLWAIERF